MNAGSSVRSTGLEPVPVSGHAPQTCAYADSATTAEERMNYTALSMLCQDGLPEKRTQKLTKRNKTVNLKTSIKGG